jgi:hypothetical protein
VTAALLISYWYRYNSHLDKIPIPGAEVPKFGAYLGAIPVLIVAIVMSLAVNRAYNQTRGRSFIDEVYV